jgi:hypothetical protein
MMSLKIESQIWAKKAIKSSIEYQFSQYRQVFLISLIVFRYLVKLSEIILT